MKWISHGFTCVPHPDPPSHLPLYPLPLGLPSAPGPSACLMHPTCAGDLFHPRQYQIAFLFQFGWLYGLNFPHSVNVMCWLISFYVLKHLCISGTSPTWSWYIIIPICCWISSASTLLRIFSSIHEIYCSVVVFSFTFFWLWHQGIVGLRDWVRKGSLLFKYLEKFEKNWYLFLFSLIYFTN